MRCEYCDNEVPGNSANCPSCGAITKVTPVPVTVIQQQEVSIASNPTVFVSSKSKTTAIVLGALLGALGLHNFYLGYNSKGIVQLLITLCTCGYGAIISWIWAVCDIVGIANGTIRDASGGVLQ